MSTPHTARLTRLCLTTVRPTTVRYAALLALALSSAHGPVQAQPTPATPRASASLPAAGASAMAPATRMARGDINFVKDAAEAGMGEVMLGKLAQQRGASNDVRQHGERMAADHTKANDELVTLARVKGLDLPATPTAAQQRLHDNMAKLDGADFDRLYLADMVRAHRKAVALFEEQARSGEDAELKAFAQKTLPTLQDHLKMTTALHDSAEQQPKR